MNNTLSFENDRHWVQISDMNINAVILGHLADAFLKEQNEHIGFLS